MSILICTPCYGGQATAGYLRSCLDLKESLTQVGLSHDWLLGTNESLVTRARNEMTASFLKTDYTHMLWIDADIEFKAEDVASLWNMDEDVAVGVYPMKLKQTVWDIARRETLLECAKLADSLGPKKVSEAIMKRAERMGWSYAAWVDGSLVKDLDQFSHPIDVDFAGTGFMMIKREVISRLAEDAPWYEGPNGRVSEIYQSKVVDHHLDSEDYHFCRTWRAIGGKIVMDPSIRLLHHGSFAYGS